ncbi:MAG: inositol transport system permease protein [Chloroflexota bacterium]|nr:inositol transport system permease protein [Chloroflexota bacterium]
MQNLENDKPLKDIYAQNDKVPFYKNPQFWKSTGIFWALVLLVIIMAFSQPAFLTKPNLINILKQASITGILAIGLTLVLLTGGIDLGVGSVLAVACMAAAFLTTEDQGFPVIVAFIAGIGVGAIFGLINGFGIAYIGFAPFIMTMATLSAARGIALVSTNNRPIFNLSRAFIDVSNSIYFGLPSLVYYFLIVAVLAYILTKKTVFGKWIYAVGGNQTAAKYSGINVEKVKLIIYMIMGSLSGLTGVLMASRITSGNPTVGEGYELDAIAACVIGGVSMSGGAGSVIGTVIGVLILGVISNGFDILGISSNYQRIMKGLVILLAVFIDIRSRSRKTN